LKILAFSDIHGNLGALRALKGNISEDYDLMIIPGDLTNAFFASSFNAMVKQFKAVLSSLESFGIKYLFTLGNRDYPLFGDESLPEQEAKDRNRALMEILQSLSNGFMLEMAPSVDIGGLKVTSRKDLASGAVYMTHYDKGVASDALIHVEGHTHAGQRNGNYLNLAFLYRDGTHGSSPLLGCYWTLEISNGRVEIRWHNLGGKMKEFECPVHAAEGKFYVPFYFRKCPVCYNKESAKFSSVGTGTGFRPGSASRG